MQAWEICINLLLLLSHTASIMFITNLILFKILIRFLGKTDMRLFGFSGIKFCVATLYFCVFIIICLSISEICVRFYGLAFDSSRQHV